MIQTHDIVLWSGPQDMSIKAMTDLAFNVLNELRDFGGELSPNYLSAYKKSDVRYFDLNKDNLNKVIENSINKEVGCEFLELGRSFGFFSSLDDNESCGIMFHIGAINTMPSPNSLIVDLPSIHFSGFNSRKREFTDLFKRLIMLFHPYFAFIANNLNQRALGQFWKNGKPAYVHWINFYSRSTAEKVGFEKILTLDNIEVLDGGYFFKLQDEPLDINNPVHLQRQKEITEQLGL